MDNLTVAQRLTREHRQIDAGVDGIIDGSGDAAALAIALRLLREHIHAEETALFPALESAGLAMPVFVMKREHGQMWPLVRRLEAACAAGAGADALRGEVNALRQLLVIHNTKDEQIVYAAADRLQASGEEDGLAAVLREARMPDDWTCAAAAR